MIKKYLINNFRLNSPSEICRFNAASIFMDEMREIDVEVYNYICIKNLMFRKCTYAMWLEEIDKIFLECFDKKVRIGMFKGIALYEEYYKEDEITPCDDIDLLVAYDDIYIFLDILEQNGYELILNREKYKPSQLYVPDKEVCYHYTFSKKLINNYVGLEVHINLLKPQYGINISSDDFLNNMKKLKTCNVYTFGIEYNILYLMVHFFKHYKFSFNEYLYKGMTNTLINVSELNRLYKIISNSKISWNKVYDLANKYNVVTVVIFIEKLLYGIFRKKIIKGNYKYPINNFCVPLLLEFGKYIIECNIKDIMECKFSNNDISKVILDYYKEKYNIIQVFTNLIYKYTSNSSIVKLPIDSIITDKCEDINTFRLKKVVYLFTSKHFIIKIVNRSFFEYKYEIKIKIYLINNIDTNKLKEYKIVKTEDSFKTFVLNYMEEEKIEGNEINILEKEVNNEIVIKLSCKLLNIDITKKNIILIKVISEIVEGNFVYRDNIIGNYWESMTEYLAVNLQEGVIYDGTNEHG